MNKLYEELAEAINDLSTLEHSIQSQNELNECRDEINRLKAKIDYIEAKLLSLQYRSIVGHLYGDLLTTRHQEKEARNDLFREDGFMKT